MFETLPSNHPVVVARRQACAQCPQMFSVPGLSEVTGPQCGRCLCFLDAKTKFVTAKCPERRWPR